MFDSAQTTARLRHIIGAERDAQPEAILSDANDKPAPRQASAARPLLYRNGKVSIQWIHKEKRNVSWNHSIDHCGVDAARCDSYLATQQGVGLRP